MDVSQAASQLLTDPKIARALLPETIETLKSGSNKQYLDALAHLALQPFYTATIFSWHHALSVELCSRWLNDSSFSSEPVAIFAALARVIPVAPYLSPYVKRLFQSTKEGPLAAFASREISTALSIPENALQEILLALCRLLRFDNAAFAHLVSPVQLQLILSHSHPSIRYLAIKNLCLYLHASEVVLQEMIGRYLGQGKIHGRWDDRTIDYIFLDLWEEKRLKDLRLGLEHALNEQASAESSRVTHRVLEHRDISPGTAWLAGVLLPQSISTQTSASSLVMTPTVEKNMASLAKAIRSDSPVMLSGVTGCGKTSLVRDAAQQLGCDRRMIVIHLNEQTDAKLLIGMYTTAGGPGSFKWQPGVLTKAVTEGRWVFVENFDRAPAEIVSTLLPLLERGELLVPHWGQTIRAAPGFKLIATVSGFGKYSGDRVLTRRMTLGIRHWQRVHVVLPSEDELGEIVTQRYPLLHAYIPKIMGLYLRLLAMNNNQTFKDSRSCSPQELFRWVTRINELLQRTGVKSGNEPILDATAESIFLEAVDCFAGSFPDGATKEQVVALIAQELHVARERVAFCLNARKPEYLKSDKLLRVGRVSLLKNHTPRSSSRRFKHNPFATTNLVLRQLESIAMAIKMAEPCLLVGETGTGKTTMIQQLAQSLNHKLVIVNLSQQSEAGDLLGGFKPVNMRTLAIPMKDEFEDLFGDTFSSNKNQRFIEHVTKAVSKDRWSRVLTLWREAATMVESTFMSRETKARGSIEEPFMKKRKVDSQKLYSLKKRWQNFTGQLDTFQKHLESGSKGFAFSFMEGNIVKAARNGDWVLLDEINLAAPDTLDSLADLLAHGTDGSPSILLTETGETERIQAHKDFRIFGAMNPANDIGKRDLPLSLRSRFFELFIDSPDKHLEDLLPLVQAYLGSHAHDVRVSGSIAQLYLEIQKLASENRLVDGADQKPHYSLRTLARTLVYVLDIAPTYGLHRALFEGFSMSFLTLLNLASGRHVVTLMERYLFSNQKNMRALLLQTPKLPQGAGEVVKFKQYWMAKGPLPVQKQDHYIITPFIEKNLLNLVRATSTRRFPVLLQGPTSSGKTSMVEYLANISGHKFVRINNHEHTDLQEYLGTYVSGFDGQLVYQEGILVQALREGFWIVLDELNLAPTDVLEALNRLLDDNRELFIPETQQVVRPHENFMLFATQNPPGMYGGRKVLSRAFKNRFLELHFDDIPEDELEVILRERSQIAPSFCAKIVAVYKKLSLHRQHSRLFEQKNSFATLRDLFRWASRDADDREQLAIDGYYLLAERVRDDNERQVVKDIIEEVMKAKIDDDAIYDKRKLPTALQLDSAAHGVVWTKSMRRLYVLVTEALKSQEPVLLVGDTGSGKTTICQVIAEAMRNYLHIVNAHRNLETGDLIGSQRPVRSRHLIEMRLHSELHKALSEPLGSDIISDSSLGQLIEAYQSLQKSTLEGIPPQVRKDVEACLSHYHALFEWVDGSLVQAMKAGQHFLFDEISLADDSVLERLNSVLEPSRQLFLAEKGVKDALVIAAEGFQFLATMNPGGDYGKKELSPALRNRFTEIWVPHASDQQEMEEILEAKLGQSQAHLAKPMVTFARWYGSNLGNASPLVSIRDLLAWVAFLDTGCIADVRSSVLHGAALVYLDTLGANPAAKLQNIGLGVQEQRKLCLDQLSMLFHFDMASAYWSSIELGIGDTKITLGPFGLRKHASASMDPAYSLRAPTPSRNALKIARALQLPRPILVEGSPGVGKTTLIAALAQACGVPLTRINLSDQTDLMDLFGSDVPLEGGFAGQFQWREAPFLRAMQHGEWVLLDEMNLASQSVLEGLNACFDHRGQVYVSELDQTFDRHPDFVVFAAQNPHHQGNGRKGLPASFVNRFTVVFADTFSADDLQMICSERFPNLPSGDIKNLTDCVTSLDVAVQQDRHLGANGGPWEINLRDTTRWLELLVSRDGLLHAARALEFIPMLFLQRFRTSEAAVAIFSLLKPYFPQLDDLHHRDFGLGARHVQVGLGLHSRQPISLFDCKGRVLPHSHLPYVESILLCVQKGWPCLLVGSSGSGKSEIIRHLASCTGADLVELSMNADMDTTDLVGGYEQLDVQREHAAFTARLNAFCKDISLQRLRSAQGRSASLTELASYLSAEHADLQRVVELLRIVAGEFPEMEWNPFVREGEAIVGKSRHDNRARFEWVDGILVRAVVEGKWLVLDNANLCSPSVLDRLNSLLEPNGVLNINERRSDDGSIRVVRPHPNFRLFMTMDPQHGELSRAMRNRNVEIFICLPERKSFDDGINLASDSSMIRFEHFQKIYASSVDASMIREVTWIGLDHLTFFDYNLIESWCQQVSAGLLELSPDICHQFLSALKLFLNRVMSAGTIIQSIKSVYNKLSRSLGLPFGFEDAQAIQPLNNPVLLHLESNVNASNRLLRLGMSLNLFIRVMRLEARLESISQTIENQSPTQRSRLQRSIARTKSGRFQANSANNLALFLAESIKTLCLTVERIDVTGPNESLRSQYREPDFAQLEECFAFLVDLIDITHSTNFDEAEYQVYLSLGQHIIAVLQYEATTNELADVIKKGLDGLDTSGQLESGQSMDVLWSRIRAPTPRSFRQLERLMQIEQLAEQFDKFCWTSDMSINQLGELRQMIVQMGKGTVTGVQDIGNSVDSITTPLHDLEARQTVLSGSRTPYMQQEFEALRQYVAAGSRVNASEDWKSLDLLAGEPTKQSLEQDLSSPSWELFSNVAEITGINKKETALAILRSSFPINVLEKLGNVAEVPLSGFDLLRDEIMALASITNKLTAAIQDECHFVLLDILRKLHCETADIHRDYLQANSIAKDSNLQPTVWQLLDEVPPSHYLRNIVQTYLRPSWEFVAGGSSQHSLTNLSFAWILFFTACLKLYVPDRTHDPALKPKVTRDRHIKRKQELDTELSAVRHFERVTTGQDTNYRCRLLEEKLEAIGKEPAVEHVLRPEISELSQLQGVFNNTLRSIIERVPELPDLTRLLGNDPVLTQELNVLRSNIAQAVSYLRQGFRTYEDLTKPLVAMLLGLDAGLAMAQIAVTPRHDRALSVEHICRSTPFFDMRPGFLSSENPDSRGLVRKGQYDPRLKFLETFTVTNAMFKVNRPAILTQVFRTFHILYEGWKTQLGEDQQRDLAKSSMYRYRGGEADAEANDDEEFSELFPDYESGDFPLANRNEPRSDPQELAQRLAHYQRGLFELDQSPTDCIIDLMRSSSADVARVSQSELPTLRSPMPPRNFLCVLLLKLDEETERLTQIPKPSTLINFYTDPNLQEARKLVSLVRRLQARFSELKQAWPEHSTLEDVLQTISELLVLRHTEPVARLITKVEKLHGYVHEWHAVASREYSVSALYEQLTLLIVDWRRLELATWSRLFDMEDRRCEAEVDAWWFVAYEAIVATPLSILEAGDDLQSHAEALFVTLQGFVTNTVFGHFRLRIQLLETFQKYLGLVQRTIPAFETIHNTLFNFLTFYKRYVAPTQQHLQTGRLTLEKEVKDVILLASWKDTNVNALRESAKRSHHKLFKVVRRYRALLARPIQAVMEGGFPDYVDVPTTVAIASQSQAEHTGTNDLVELNELPYNWTERPTRFKNIPSTISYMVSMSRIHPSVAEIPKILDRYFDSLYDDVKSLKKETPTTATEDSAELLKHLTARKRKLLSNTLKTVRHMGFRTNLSGDALSRQASLAVILSQILPIDSSHDTSIFNMSEHRLHQLLSLMPMVRAAAQAHSEDLNRADVTRCIGYLESMLSHVVKQRHLSGKFGNCVSGLNQIVQQMQNLWKPEEYNVVVQSLESDTIENIQRTVSSLIHIIDTGCLIIEKHGKFGETDYADTCKNLQGWSTKFQDVTASFKAEPILPTRLTYSQQQPRYVGIQSLLQSFRDDVSRQIKEYPHLAFVLEQIALWIDNSHNLASGHTPQDAAMDVKEFDQKLMRTCDTILVVVQAFEQTASTTCSIEDQNWLVDSGKALADGVKALHVEKLATKIGETMADLCRLNQEDLRLAAALVAMALPIVKQYREICHNLLDHLAMRSKATNRMAATLAGNFSKLASQGFCNPSKSGPAEAGKNEKLEDGTGLGEGEGAEDISKDIQDDEDLSELAQEGQKDKKDDEISDQQDAVNMDHDELEGEEGGSQEEDGEGDEGSKSGSDDGDEIDEETGDVDDLDPNAVDEKLWDDEEQHSEKEKQGSKPKGAGKTDDQPHAKSDEKNPDEEGVDDEQLSDAGAEEGEGVAQQEAEMMDPHAQQAENLDLPEEMDFDGPEKPSMASDSEGNDLDDLSNKDAEEHQQPDDITPDDGTDETETSKENQMKQDDEANVDQEESNIDEADEAESPVDTDPEQDDEADGSLLQNRADDAAVDKENVVPSEAQGLEGQDADEDAETRMQESKAAGGTGKASEHAPGEQSQAPADAGEVGNMQDHTKDNPERLEQRYEDQTNQAFKKLGDALEKWHRQHEQIQAAQPPPGPEQDTADIEMADPEFQHLEDEGAKADTQALGAATDDQAHTLDQRALDSEMQDQPHDFLPDEAEEEEEDEEDTIMEDANPRDTSLENGQEQFTPTTFIGSNPQQHHQTHDPNSNNLSNDLNSPDIPTSLVAPHLEPPSPTLPRSLASAQKLWSQHSTSTHPLSLTLTEQLRLTLSPTLATKMRGDFRTGKRLNIKRIIPYIASQYKRDKIWMRRSVPSKRNYQIMLAIDDSKSMAEGGSGSADLAFETLALVASSLSMLEAGEICIVGFGEEVVVAHPFGQTFSADAGVHAFRHFGFRQRRTDVGKLLREALTMFGDARRRSSFSSHQGEEIWQLMFIVGDGVCEDHEGLR
ncbi:MAG: hypothetical protein Q9216_003662, partial [Gyalolechia sp. 2 TL-2023]